MLLIWKLLSFALLCQPAYGSVLLQRACNSHRCFMNVGNATSVTSDCASFFQIVPFTERIANATTSTTRTITISRGDVLGSVLGLLTPDTGLGTTSSIAALTLTYTQPIPTYASNCDKTQYSSACRCLGLSPLSTTTLYSVTTYTLLTTTWIYKYSISTSISSSTTLLMNGSSTSGFPEITSTPNNTESSSPSVSWSNVTNLSGLATVQTGLTSSSYLHVEQTTVNLTTSASSMGISSSLGSSIVGVVNSTITSSATTFASSKSDKSLSSLDGESNSAITTMLLSTMDVHNTTTPSKTQMSSSLYSSSVLLAEVTSTIQLIPFITPGLSSGDIHSRSSTSPPRIPTSKIIETALSNSSAISSTASSTPPIFSSAISNVLSSSISSSFSRSSMDNKVCRLHPDWCMDSSLSTMSDDHSATISHQPEPTETEDHAAYPTEYLPEPSHVHPTSASSLVPSPQSPCYSDAPSTGYYPILPASYESCSQDPDDPDSRIQLRDPDSGQRIGGDGMFAKIVSEKYDGYYTFVQPSNAPCGVYDLVLHTPDDYRYVAIAPSGDLRFRWESSDGQRNWKHTRTDSVTTVWSVRCDGTLQAGIVGGMKFSFVVDSNEQLINVMEDDIA